MFIKKLIISILVILSTATMVGLPRLRAEAVSTEDKVKAAYLFNFAKFVEWPSESFKDSNGFFNICVIGEGPFGNALDSLQNHELKGKSVKVYRISKAGDTEECHIAFISSSKKRRLGRVLADLNGSGVLSISDIENFAQKGGIINFVKIEKKIRFEINMKAAERAGLKISSKLLNLAETIYGK